MHEGAEDSGLIHEIVSGYVNYSMDNRARFVRLYDYNAGAYYDILAKKIIPTLKDIVKKKTAARRPTILFASGVPTAGKTTFALNDLMAILPKELKVNAQVISADYCIRPRSEREKDERGVSTEDPFKKFEFNERYVPDMLALSEGKAIHIPIFDQKKRGRYKIEIDGRGYIFITNFDMDEGGRAQDKEAEVKLIDGRFQFLYRGEIKDAINMGDKESGLAIKNGQGESFIITIRNTEHRVYKKNNVWFVKIGSEGDDTELEQGGPLELKQEIIPGQDLIIVEGILAFYGKRMQQAGDGFIFMDLPYNAQKQRVIHRVRLQTGRADPSKAVEKFHERRLTEEPFVYRQRAWILEELKKDPQAAMWVLSTMARAEVIFSIFKEDRLGHPEFRGVFLDIGWHHDDIEAIYKGLKDIERSFIMGKLGPDLSRHPQIAQRSIFRVREVQGANLIIKEPLNRLGEDVLTFYLDVLRERMYGLVAAGAVVSLGYDSNNRVFVQDKIETLEDYIAVLLKEKRQDEAKYFLEEFFKTLQEMWRRGVIDLEPLPFNKYGIEVIDGARKVVSLAIDGFSVEKGLYAPAGLKRILADNFKDCLGRHPEFGILKYTYDSLVEKYIVDINEFDGLFESPEGFSRAEEVPNISNTELDSLQMDYIVKKVLDAKVNVLKELFNRKREEIRGPRVLVWSKAYLGAILSPGNADYIIIAEFVSRLENNPGILTTGMLSAKDLIDDIKDEQPENVKKALAGGSIIIDMFLKTLGEVIINAELPLNKGPSIDGDAALSLPHLGLITSL